MYRLCYVLAWWQWSLCQCPAVYQVGLARQWCWWVTVLTVSVSCCAPGWTGETVVLVGDSAHCVSVLLCTRLDRQDSGAGGWQCSLCQCPAVHQVGLARQWCWWVTVLTVSVSCCVPGWTGETVVLVGDSAHCVSVLLCTRLDWRDSGAGGWQCSLCRCPAVYQVGPARQWCWWVTVLTVSVSCCVPGWTGETVVLVGDSAHCVSVLLCTRLDRQDSGAGGWQCSLCQCPAVHQVGLARQWCWWVTVLTVSVSCCVPGWTGETVVLVGDSDHCVGVLLCTRLDWRDSGAGGWQCSLCQCPAVYQVGLARQWCWWVTVLTVSVSCCVPGWTGQTVVLVGDSAGANLVVAAALRAAHFGVRIPDGVVSIYGCMLVKYIPSPSRILALMDPLLPLGVLSKCLAGEAASQPPAECQWNSRVLY